eukprot:4319263-Amphidinium_carterae.1
MSVCKCTTCEARSCNAGASAIGLRLARGIFHGLCAVGGASSEHEELNPEIDGTTCRFFLFVALLCCCRRPRLLIFMKLFEFTSYVRAWDIFRLIEHVVPQCCGK